MFDYKVLSCNQRHLGWGQAAFTFLLFMFFTGCVYGQSAWPEVVPGIEYIHHRIGDKPWSVHMIKVDRAEKQFALVSSLAKNTIKGLTPLSKQIKSLPKPLGKPAAGINGDFFQIQPGPYQGDPTGLQIIQQELISDPRSISFWMDVDDQPQIGKVTGKFQIIGPNNLNLSFGLNQERKNNAAVLYTPTFGATTCTISGWEIILEKIPGAIWLPLQVGLVYQSRIREIRTIGDTTLEPDIMVLSVGPELISNVSDLKTGMIVTLSLQTEPDLSGVQTALGGGPVLLKKGKVESFGKDKSRHPRSAIGWDDSHFFLVVVDGRQKRLSIGMTFAELAELMQNYGCQEAINLDGGGSSTLWLGGKVMNSPSDGRERSIANGLIIIQKEKVEKD